MLWQAVREAVGTAAPRARDAARHALCALAGPQLPDKVVGAAAALTAEAALCIFRDTLQDKASATQRCLLIRAQ